MHCVMCSIKPFHPLLVSRRRARECRDYMRCFYGLIIEYSDKLDELSVARRYTSDR